MGYASRGNPRAAAAAATVAAFGGGTGGAAVIRDAYRRVLSEGDLVHVHTVLPPAFQVQKITPILQPGLPANLMQITLFCTLQFMAQRDQPNLEFSRILDREEARALRGETPGDPHGDPPVPPDGERPALEIVRDLPEEDRPIEADPPIDEGDAGGSER